MRFSVVERQLGYSIIITEFGGRCGEGDLRDVVWHRKFIEYPIENSIYHWFYLALNPEHPETRGLLKDDWNTVKENKYSLLKILMRATLRGIDVSFSSRTFFICE